LALKPGEVLCCLPDMSTVAETESALARLSIREAEEAQERLEQ